MFNTISGNNEVFINSKSSFEAELSKCNSPPSIARLLHALLAFMLLATLILWNNSNSLQGFNSATRRSAQIEYIIIDYQLLPSLQSNSICNMEIVNVGENDHLNSSPT